MASGALAVVEHNLIGYRRAWRGTAFSTFITPILYLLAMGIGVGQLVDRGAGTASLDVGYLEFLGPGLLAATVMQIGAGESMWQIMAGLEWRKTFLWQLSTPLSVRQLVVGQLAWSAIRILLTATWYAIVLALFDIAPVGRTLAAIPWALLLGLSFGAPVLAFTSRLKDSQGLTNLQRFGIVPLFLFSGTFFPIEQLPAWIRPVAAFTPLWHGVELIRATILGTPTAWPVLGHVTVMLGFLLVGVGLASTWLHRRLRT